jgi:hypothetical protein
MAGARLLVGPSWATGVEVSSPTSLVATMPAGSATLPSSIPHFVVVNPDGRAFVRSWIFFYQPDADADGLDDDWETAHFGDLSEDAQADPDRDTLTNLQEYRQNTDPEAAVRYFAEGANFTGPPGFRTRIAIANPQPFAVDYTLDFLTIDLHDLSFTPPSIAPGERVTIDTSILPGLENTSFATTVSSTHGLVVDRTMSWDATGYGSHAETGLVNTGRLWYLAEGATHSNFKLFYLLQNPNPADVVVRVTYLRTAPLPAMVALCRVSARSRANIYVNAELCPGNQYEGTPPTLTALPNEDVSAMFEVIQGGGILVERAMYRSPGFEFYSGTATAAVAGTSTRWFLAEGATGDLFDTYVLLANPTDRDAVFRLRLLRMGDVSITLTDEFDPLSCDPFAYPAPCGLLTVKAHSRRTIWLDGLPGLANTGVSTIVEVMNGVGILVERAMWWPGSFATWTEGHASFGTTTTGTKWAVADGEVGGPTQAATYVLIANTGFYPARVRATVLFDDGTPAVSFYIDDVPAGSRANINLTPGTIAGYAALAPYFDAGVVAAGRKFGVIVESENYTIQAGAVLVPLTAQPIVVERAMYSSDANAPTFLPYWPAGTNAVATRLQ